MVSPVSPQELGVCQKFMLENGGVSPSEDARYIGWIDEGDLKILVCLNGFIGKLCQMHIAMAPGYNFSPREMLAECFSFAFNTCGREMVIGVVNSANVRAMRYDIHLGFKELYRLKGMHDGGDVVLLGMARADCPWLNVLTEDGHAPKFLGYDDANLRT